MCCGVQAMGTDLKREMDILGRAIKVPPDPPIPSLPRAVQPDQRVAPVVLCFADVAHLWLCHVAGEGQLPEEIQEG